MQATCEHGPGSPSIEYVDGWTNGEAQQLCGKGCDGTGSLTGAR